PFGPISAWISPGRRSSETPSVARSAPNDLLRFDSSRIGSAMTLSMPGLSGEKPNKASPRKEYRTEQDQAKEELPALRQSTQYVFEDHEQHGAGQRPEQATDTAQDNQHDQFTRHVPGEHGRADEAVEISEQRPRKAGNRSRDRE